MIKRTGGFPFNAHRRVDATPTGLPSQTAKPAGDPQPGIRSWGDILKIFQAMNRGVIVTDASGIIIQMNHAAENIMGLKRRQVLSRRLADLPWRITCPDGLMIPAERMPDVRALKEKRVIRDAVFGLIKADGTKVWLGITSAPLNNGSGETEALVLTISDVTRIYLAEEALQTTNSILEAVSFAANRFLLTSEWEACLPLILEHLGKAGHVSRTYIFRNFHLSDGEPMTTQIAEWSYEPDLSQQDYPECQIHYWRGGGMERWMSILPRGEVIHSHIKDLPESEKALLSPQGIKSILVVPVLVASEWWGFMGYDECERERSWSSAEVDALKTAADILGAAIERDLLEKRTRKLQESLQDALAKVLSGYLPICAVCKKIRDENNRWRVVESYIRDHSELVLSQGICPECVEKFCAPDAS